MSYTHDQFVVNLANMLQIDPPTDTNYQTALPTIIDDAEQRMYRELDLLETILRNTAGTTTTNNRLFTFPQHFVVSESINIFVPFGTVPGAGVRGRQQLIPVSREFLDAVYPDDYPTGDFEGFPPHYYAMLTDQTILLG